MEALNIINRNKALSGMAPKVIYKAPPTPAVGKTWKKNPSTWKNY